MKYFECHVTLHPEDGEEAKPIAARLGFKTSKIDGDEHLEDKIWFYCTKSMKHFEELQNLMEQLCDELQEAGIGWVRKKIEGIIIDVKHSSRVLLAVSEGGKRGDDALEMLRDDLEKSVTGLNETCLHYNYSTGLQHNDPVFVCKDCGYYWFS